MNDNTNFEIIDVIRFERQPSDYCTPKRDFSVISCRLNGTAEFIYNKEITKASPIQYVYIPANINYSQKGGNEEIICVHFKENGNLYKKIMSFKCPSPRMKENFLLLNNLWRKKESGYIFKCKSILYDILYSFHKADSTSEIQNAQQLISDSMNYIDKNFYKNDFSLSKAISLSNVSEAYFRKIFKTVYKMTPVKYIRTLKISRAKTLLLSRAYSLSQISEMCGFSEEKYFYAVFRNITGQTPTEWKNIN